MSASTLADTCTHPPCVLLCLCVAAVTFAAADNTNRFDEQIVQTAHSEKISSLAFPQQYGEVFATCSLGCIRVWHLRGCRELLRISVPNLECRCITFAPVSA